MLCRFTDSRTDELQTHVHPFGISTIFSVTLLRAVPPLFSASVSEAEITCRTLSTTRGIERERVEARERERESKEENTDFADVVDDDGDAEALSVRDDVIQ